MIKCIVKEMCFYRGKRYRVGQTLLFDNSGKDEDGKAIKVAPPKYLKPVDDIEDAEVKKVTKPKDPTPDKEQIDIEKQQALAAAKDAGKAPAKGGRKPRVD